MDHNPTSGPSRTQPQPDTPEPCNRSLCTVHVCTSCRPPGIAREPEENRPGFRLFHKLREAFEARELGSLVHVKPTSCLSLCPRPCALALSMPGSWTYLFGDQDPEVTVHDVVTCVSLYLDSPKGFMARGERPRTLRGSILGRVPPIEESVPCI